MTTPLSLRVAVERWPIRGSFAISRGAKTEAVVVVAELGDGKAVGRGECVPYRRYSETVEGVVAAIEASVRVLIEGGPGLGRPLVDTIKGSRHHHMKELRPP